MTETRPPLRQFWQIGILSSLSAVSVSMGINLGVRTTDIGDFDQRNYNLPKWLNPGGEPLPKFINAENGHEDYLRTLAMRSPVLRSAISKIMEIKYHHPQKEPPLLGDEFALHLSIIKKVFDEESTQTPEQGDLVRAAILTLAVSTILSPAEIESCTDITFSDHVQTNILQRQVAITTSPRVFPVSTPNEISEAELVGRYLGIDRFKHFALHLALVSELIHFHYSGVKDIDLMPEPIAQVLEDFYPNGISELDFSEAAGRAWEALRGLQDPPWDVLVAGANSGVPTGAYDKFMTLDIAANRLGSIIGAILFKGRPENGDFQKIFNVLNNPAITNLVEDKIYPEVDLAFAEVLLS